MWIIHQMQRPLKLPINDICCFSGYPVRNMRSIICYILISSVLFMGTEGLWDMAKETHPHDDVYAHQMDANHSSASDKATNTDDCADHCPNVCHGHSSSIISVDSGSFLLTINEYSTLTNIDIPARTLAPPTPPPSA